MASDFPMHYSSPVMCDDEEAMQHAEGQGRAGGPPFRFPSRYHGCGCPTLRCFCEGWA
jgi:hypothetical protein